MRLQELTVGPIVGETTPTRARIWGRGDTTVIDGKPRRCFGTLRYRQQGAASWHKPLIFKLNPNFDMTGVAILGGLQPETRYEYQVGHFFSDGELPDASFREADWSAASTGHFCSASDNPKQSRTLVIGSCRYLLKTFMGDFFDDRGDKTFRTILDHIKSGTDVHQVVMMGDQIYADDLNSWLPDRTINQFYRRYRDAFSQKHLRELMSQVPTYMTLDDHEIEDDWPSNAAGSDWQTLFPVAIHAYQAYQLCHGPNIPVRRGRLVGTPSRLWYQYSDGCCAVFVTDSRTERFLNGNDRSREMISREQMRALKRWLADGSEQVKLVITSVPFFPDTVAEERVDKWSGFNVQRQELLKHIESRRIKKVVFCSGDVHASMSAELHSPSGLKILSVISSAFFWPYPHPSARHFRMSGMIDGGTAGEFRIVNPSRLISDDNFTRLHVTPSAIKVAVFGRKGEARSVTEHRFD